MVQKKAVRNFLQGAIEHLSKEDFDELVRIFQLSYWQNTDKVYQKTTVIDMNKEVRVVYKRVRAKMRSWINSVEFEKSARSFF